LADTTLDCSLVMPACGDQAMASNRMQSRRAAPLTIGNSPHVASQRLASVASMWSLRAVARQMLSIVRAARRGWLDLPSLVSVRRLPREAATGVEQRLPGMLDRTRSRPAITRRQVRPTVNLPRVRTALVYPAITYARSTAQRKFVGDVPPRSRDIRHPALHLLGALVRPLGPTEDASRRVLQGPEATPGVDGPPPIRLRIGALAFGPRHDRADRQFVPGGTDLSARVGAAPGLSPRSPLAQQTMRMPALRPPQLSNTTVAPEPASGRPFAPLQQRPQNGIENRSVSRMQNTARSSIASNIYLDGNALGRWMTAYFEEQVNRPHAGITAVDPRLGPMFAGPPIGM
jgi:hypothetical protein